MNFVSLFSGIGGFDLAFERAGLTCAWQSEIDPAASALLERRFPGIPNLGDVRNVNPTTARAVDLVCGGFPCQDVSIAGKRAGLAGDRSGLWFEFHRVLAELRPAWVVIENVPGLLSSNGGRDFAAILYGLGELGYRSAWRILDAQYFGVPQRRRRVFIVGHLRDGRAAEVLFESESLCGYPPPRPGARQDVAGSLDGRAGGGGFPGSDDAMTNHVVAGTLAAGAHPGSYNERDAERGSLIVADEIAASIRTGYSPNGHGHSHGLRGDGSDNIVIAQMPTTFDWQAGVSANDRASVVDPPGLTRGLNASRTLAVFGGNNTSGEIDVATALNAHGGSGRMDFESETFVFEARYARNGRGAPDTIAPPLKAESGQTGKGDAAPLVVFQSSQSGVRQVETHATLDGNNGSRRHNGVIQTSGVRRLTPLECERLQGFYDNYTDGQSDSARYRQLGNAVCVPVVEWIARRIVEAA